MATIKKLTKADKFGMLLEIPEVKDNETLKEFVEHELGLLAKKNSAEKKPTKVQEANKELQEAILGTMVKGKSYTVTELIKTVPECADLTNQKVSALVRSLVKSEALVRTEEKGKAYFSLA